MTDGQIKSRGRPRAKPPEERREELLDAALGLFSRRGYEATSVEQIARSVGVAKGTFYLYFGSKEDLMLALRDRLRASFRRENEERFRRLAEEHEISFEEFVEASIDFAFDFYCENWSVFSLVYRRFSDESVREVEENRLRHVEPLANAIERAVERGEAGTGGQDPTLFAYLLSGAIEENIYSCLAFGNPSDVESLREATKAFAKKALAPEPVHAR